MIANEKIYIRSADLSAFSSIKVGADKDNSTFFLGGNTSTVYSLGSGASVDFGYDALIFVEGMNSLITHGRVWQLGMPDSMTEAAVLPYRHLGHTLYKRMVSTEDLNTKSVSEIFGSAQIGLVDIRGFIRLTNGTMGSAFNFIGATFDSSSLLCTDIYAEVTVEQSGSNYVEVVYYVG